jgi:hypothetical protein
MNTPATNGKAATVSSSRPQARRPGGKAMEMANKRRALMKVECERRGVRFLPAQVMREIYERNGLL